MRTLRNPREKKKGIPLDTHSAVDGKSVAKTDKGRVLNCRELTQRILQLESELKEIVGILNETSEFQNVLLWRSLNSPEQNRKKTGPSPKIYPEYLFQRRDNLIWWLEENWSRIENPLLVSRCDTDIRRALTSVLFEREETKKALEFCGLYRLYEKRRLRMEPTVKMLKAFANKDPDLPPILDELPSRALANALAGVPEISCRSSLDRCAKTPSRQAPALSMWIYYSKRYDNCPAPIVPDGFHDRSR